jgi:hypothetical protein
VKNKIIIPHEHGGWAMVSVPFVFGMFAGNPQWVHILLFLAWLFLYLASYPFLQAVKKTANRGRLIKWGVLYALIAIVCVALPLYQNPELLYFALPLIGLLLINIWHAKRKSEREMLNDLCALLIFSLGGAAAYFMGGGGWDQTMVMVVLFNFLYFTGTVFFVKSIFRKRGNKRFLIVAIIYHMSLLIIPWIVGAPWMMLSYIFAVVRTFAFAGKKMRPMIVGIIEIIGAIFFLLVSVIVIQWTL